MVTNRYSLSKYLLVFALVAIGVLYAAPNLYGEDPAVQVTARGVVPDKLSVLVTEMLQQIEITPMAMEESEKEVLLRFADEDIQLKAFEQLQKLGKDYAVALNIAPATPARGRKGLSHR